MAWTADIDSLIDLGSQDCTYQKRAQGIIASGGERLDKQQLFPDSINSTSLNLMVGRFLFQEIDTRRIHIYNTSLKACITTEWRSLTW